MIKVKRFTILLNVKSLGVKHNGVVTLHRVTAKDKHQAVASAIHYKHGERPDTILYEHEYAFGKKHLPIHYVVSGESFRGYVDEVL